MNGVILVHFAVAVHISGLIYLVNGGKHDVLQKVNGIILVYLAIAVHISPQPNLRVLRLRIAAHRHGILPGDVVLLRHLHGVGTGGNPGDVVNCGIFPAAIFPGGHRCGVLGLRAAVGKQGDGYIAVIVEAHHLSA